MNIQEAQKLLDDLTAGISIDKFALDEMWEAQPELFNEAARAYAMCMAKRDEADHDHDLVQAEIDRNLRVKYQEEKVTEKRLASEVLEHPRTQNAYINWAAWNHMAECFRALKESYTQRRDALQDLTKLHLASYFGQSNQAR